MYKSCVTMQVKSDWAECPTDSISIHSSYVGIFKFTQTLKQSQIKFYIPERTNAVIRSDAEQFEIFKSNGEEIN